MAIVIPNAGEATMLSYLVNKIAASENLVLRLYTNDYTPIAASVAGSFTEAAGNGYAAITLTGASWTVTGGSPSTAAYAKQTFTFTGALGNVYGYYLTRASSGDIVAAERFASAPYNVQNNGDKIEVTITLTNASVTSD